jgi:glycine betaine/proline transport system substrate-binding protein
VKVKLDQDKSEQLEREGAVTRYFHAVVCLIATLTAIGTTTCALASEPPLPGAGITVQPVQQYDILSLFQVGIVLAGLERLGYTVAPPKSLNVALYYAALAQGDGDFGAQTWWPAHKFAYEHAGGESKMTLLGSVVARATQGYFIDKRTAEEFKITNLAQLKDPTIAALFASKKGDKAGLIGCEPGWACEKIIDYQIKAYGLSDTVEQVKGTASILFANIASKYKNGDRILYYSFTPLWVNSVLVAGKDVESIAVPFTALPPGTTEGEPHTITPDGRNVGWEITDLKVVANNEFLAKNPAAKRWFELVTIPVEDVNREAFVIHEGEKSPEAIHGHAMKWIADHQSLFDGWVNQVLAESRH